MLNAVDPCQSKIEDWHYAPPITADRLEDIQKPIPQKEV
jgi:hypothetical protein